MQAYFSDLQQMPRAYRRGIFCTTLLAIAITCAAILVTDVNRIRTENTGDFEHFFYAAQAVHQGNDPYAAWTRGYIYPPLIAFLFQPLALLGRDRAAAVMLVVNVAVTLLAVALASIEFLRRLNVRREPMIVAGVMLGAMLLNIDKIKGEWQMWQTDVFMLLMFVLALRWIDRWPVASGLIMGLGVNIKYLPLMFLPYLLVRRRWTVAGSLIVGTLGFAMLPAVSTGWDANLRNWGTATRGLVQMAGGAGGQTKTVEAAEVHDVKDSLSCSITSACARGVRSSSAAGFAVAAGVAALAFMTAFGIYRRWGIPMFSPALASDQSVTGIEWVMLVAVVLAFGPQTNTRHLFDALIFTSAASALLLFARRDVNRWPLIVGTAVLFFGFILPPGNRTRIGEHTPTVIWTRMGGPCWCLLVAAFTLLWTGFENANRAKTADAKFS